MPQTFCVKTCCFKCQSPMREMWIAGFKVPYCPKCTNPNKKKKPFHTIPEDKARLIKNKKRDKKKVHDYYWKKNAVKISSRKSLAMKEKERIHKKNLKVEHPFHKLINEINK